MNVPKSPHVGDFDVDLTWDDRFSAAWPSVERRMRNALRGWSGTTMSDDAAQESALRAILRRVEFADADELFAWTIVVARRIIIDELRRRAHHGDLGYDDERRLPMCDDIAVAFTSSDEVETLKRWLADLSDRDRHALFWASCNADYIRRHRVRSRLRQEVPNLP